jgi:hypothetical protein
MEDDLIEVKVTIPRSLYKEICLGAEEAWISVDKFVKLALEYYCFDGDGDGDG